MIATLALNIEPAILNWLGGRHVVSGGLEQTASAWQSVLVSPCTFHWPSDSHSTFQQPNSKNKKKKRKGDAWNIELYHKIKSAFRSISENILFRRNKTKTDPVLVR